MTAIHDAVAVVLRHEGGFTVDHAGATNYGISLITAIAEGDRDADGVLDFDLDFDGDVDASDIRAMTQSDAVAYYEALYVRLGLGSIDRSAVAIKWFDLAVNMGMRQATRIAQRAAKANGIGLVDDGLLGPKTRRAINVLPASSTLVGMRSEAAGFYRVLVARNAPKYGPYLTGWLRRAYD